MLTCLWMLVFTFTWGHLWCGLVRFHPFIATGTCGIAYRSYFWVIITRRAICICFLDWRCRPFRWLITVAERKKSVWKNVLIQHCQIMRFLSAIIVVVFSALNLHSFDIFLFWHDINRRSISNRWYHWRVWWFFDITQFYRGFNIRMITCWLFRFIGCITCRIARRFLFGGGTKESNEKKIELLRKHIKDFGWI